MKVLHGLKLSYRFTILIALFTFGFLFYGVWSFKTLQALKVNGPVYQRIVQGKDLIADILPPPEYIIESYLVSMQLYDTTEKAAQDALVDRLKTLKKEYDERHGYWQKEHLEPELAVAFLDKAHAPAAVFYDMAFGEFIPSLQKGDRDSAGAVMVRMRQAYEAHRAAIDQVVQITTKRNEADEADARERIDSAMLWSVVIFAGSLAASFVVSTIISRGLLRGLGGEPAYALQVAGQIADGDLTARISVKDGDRESLLFAMKTMQEALAKTVAGIKTAVDSVSTGAQQIAIGNGDLSQRTVEQASSLDESSASMERLTATIRQNTENSRQANQLAMSASEVALKGGAVVADVVQTMGEIHASSKKIVDIIAVIDGIAFQTNILALNAAVEAARAGEQGLGFAVVAAEVRGLAQRSASAAKEIKQLIDDSVDKVNAGSALVDQAGKTMDEIVAGVKRVTDIINEISAASEEQTNGMVQISHSIQMMEEMTQQNAALVEQASAAANSLQQQAGELAQSVRAFNVDAAFRPAARLNVALLPAA
ncbi:methyl-accepting chemotaxis protein [Herbaspirillum sp. HC18]|nr:methyl-accepting chemotaxis protein [Herbaspirillum sp. HC18]